MEKVICSLGQCTFGIYLLHIFIKDELGLTKWMEDMLQGKISNMLYAFCIVEQFLFAAMQLRL